MDHAAVTTHLDGIEMSDEFKGRIRVPHEECNGVRNPLASPTVCCVDMICHLSDPPFPTDIHAQRGQFIGGAPHALARGLARDGGSLEPGSLSGPHPAPPCKSCLQEKTS